MTNLRAEGRRMLMSFLKKEEKMLRSPKIQYKSYLIVLFALFLSLSCVQQKKDDVREVGPHPAPGVFIAIDGSRSFKNHFNQGKMKLKKLVELLPAGTSVIVRWITSDSYRDYNAIITKTLPSEVEASKNVYDKRQRVARIKAQLELKNGREEIWAAILNAKSPRSWYSDIYGFLLVVAERIGQYRNEGRPVYLILLSDMKDNWGSYERYVERNCLSGLKVYLLAFDTLIPELRKRWKSIFTSKLGTENPVFLGLDEEFRDIFSKGE